MGNAFDSTHYPQTEPATLVAGDRVAWKRTDLGADYPPASYTLSYEARLEGAGVTGITLTATEDGSDYLVEVSQATSANYTAGDYQWDAYITRDSDSERVRVDHGSLEIKPDRATSTDDPRSHAKIMLDAIDAALEGRASNTQLDILSYSYPTTSAQRDPESLRRWRNYYANKVRAERIQEQIANGGNDGSLVRPSFPA